MKSTMHHSQVGEQVAVKILAVDMRTKRVLVSTREASCALSLLVIHFVAAAPTSPEGRSAMAGTKRASSSPAPHLALSWNYASMDWNAVQHASRLHAVLAEAGGVR